MAVAPLSDWLAALHERLAASRAAHERLPPDGLRLDDGYHVMPLPMISTRMRVALVKPGRDEYAPVWADRWEEALAAARAGLPIPEDCRARVTDDDPEEDS